MRFLGLVFTVLTLLLASRPKTLFQLSAARPEAKPVRHFERAEIRPGTTRRSLRHASALRKVRARVTESTRLLQLHTVPKERMPLHF